MKSKKPWPTKAAMTQIYEQQLWGKNHQKYYSGEGSHQLEIVEPYINVVTSFLSTFKEPLTVCDLGCGDFNIGNQLVNFAKNYIAVDIVDELIAFNKTKYQQENLQFLSLDITKDDLPKADCAVVRQVLQHLSNKEVKNVVEKLYNYKYIIVTEHLPNKDFEPNKDIISGQGIRLKKKSGLDITKHPFDFKVKEKKTLCSIILEDKKGIIETTLFTSL